MLRAPCHLFPAVECPFVRIVEHLGKFFPIEPSVLVFENDEFLLEARRLFPLLLLAGGIAETQQADGEDVFRQVEQIAVDLVVFHDVADVTGAQPQQLGREHRRLRGDQGVAAGQEQVAFLRFPHGDFLLRAQPLPRPKRRSSRTSAGNRPGTARPAGRGR